MFLPRLLLLLPILLYGVTAAAQVSKLYPVDEADHDPSFFVFRSRLFQAITARDTVFVYAHLDPDIRNGKGVGDGVAAFKKHWRASDADSPLWMTLAQVVSAGGRFSETGLFVAPYTYTAFPRDFDAYEYGVTFGEQVRVREAPDTGSEVVGVLSYDVVPVPTFMLDWGEQAPPEGWEQIQLADGRIGYVASAYVVSPMDYRAGFRKEQDRWRMVYLVGGP